MSRFGLAEVGSLLGSCFAACSSRAPGAATASAEENIRRQLGVAQFNLQSIQNTINGLEQKKAVAVRTRNLQEAKSCVTQRHVALKKLAKFEQSCVVLQGMLDEINEAEFTKDTVAVLSKAHHEFKGLKLEKLYSKMAQLTEGLSENRSVLSETQTIFSDTAAEVSGLRIQDDAELRKELDQLLEQFEATPVDPELPTVPTTAPAHGKQSASGGMSSAYGKLGLTLQ